MNEYDPIGKFLLIAVLVGEEVPVEVPDAPDTPDNEGFEDVPDWPDEAPCVAVADCEESSLVALAYYKGVLMWLANLFALLLLFSPTASPAAMAMMDINSRTSSTNIRFQPPFL